jgi:response regulator RpfG family c-di-GMP phosphodiesterase
MKKVFNQSMRNELKIKEESFSKNKREQLLVIDDNQEVFGALSAVLREHYRLLLCTTFAEAQPFAADIKVALLDIKMAIKDGIEVFKLLKRINPKMRIIFHSAYPGDISHAEIASTLPHDGYLIKGEYTISDLSKTISDAFLKNRL